MPSCQAPDAYLASGSDQQPYHAGTAENQRRAAVSTRPFSCAATAMPASACLPNHRTYNVTLQPLRHTCTCSFGTSLHRDSSCLGMLTGHSASILRTSLSAGQAAAGDTPRLLQQGAATAGGRRQALPAALAAARHVRPCAVVMGQPPPPAHVHPSARQLCMRKLHRVASKQCCELPAASHVKESTTIRQATHISAYAGAHWSSKVTGPAGACPPATSPAGTAARCGAPPGLARHPAAPAPSTAPAAPRQ